jgi:hypothetical protein
VRARKEFYRRYKSVKTKAFNVNSCVAFGEMKSVGEHDVDLNEKINIYLLF